MWKHGAIGIPAEDGKYTGVKYAAKVYDKGSQYGIEGGRISKLTLKINGEIVANYDRGWDIKPTCDEANTALAILLHDNK